MKILHVIPSLALEDGGPTAALERMANGLNARGAAVTILTTSSEGRSETVNIALDPGIELVSLKRNFQPYKVSWPALRWLRRQITDFDVVHIHAVFSFLSVRAGLEARRRAVPYIVRPLGVLNRWGMKSGRAAVKRLSYAAFESRVMKGASFIHFTSQHEADETYQLDPQLRATPSFILPVPVSFNTRADPDLFYRKFPNFKGRKILLFLSRFGPQKGIELVIQAFARLHSEFKDWTLVLAGGGERSYEEALKNLASTAGVSGQIAWVGYLSGAEKWSALAAADAFVLPFLLGEFWHSLPLKLWSAGRLPDS